MCNERLTLSTSARVDNHVLIVSQDDGSSLVKVQQRYRTEFGRYATRRRNISIHRMKQTLNLCVIRRVKMFRQYHRTRPAAHKRLVSDGSDDPVVPFHFREVDVERPSTARRWTVRRRLPVFRPATCRRRSFALRRGLSGPSIIGVSNQDRLTTNVFVVVGTATG